MLNKALVDILERAEKAHPEILDLCEIVEEAEEALARAERDLALLNSPTQDWSGDRTEGFRLPSTSNGSSSGDAGSRRS